jgi:hypothetical protein
MLLSNSAMSGAAAEVRTLAAQLTTEVQQLASASSWTGADADRFEREWNDLVVARLHLAANKLDGVSFRELVEGFDG